MADDSSSSPGPPSGSTSSEPDVGAHGMKARRKPMPRKGHTKSRAGCYNCKRRKVKCDEQLPGCSHCRRIGFSCKYPPPSAGPGDDASSPGPSMGLQPTPTVFSLDDMHFFQHFLLAAHPTLPIGGAAVWQHMAQLAHSVSLALSTASLLHLVGGTYTTSSTTS